VVTEWPAIVREFWRLIRGGEAVAVKGIGGYHLACLATDEAAVRRLRERKRRPHRPLAVMAGSIEALHRHGLLVREREGALLASPAAPILLLRPGGATALAPSVAPGQHRICAMLPYSPLHHLLFAGGRDEALVMTSGNLAEQPQITDDAEARAAFAGIAAAILAHDCRIAVRVDDSVARLDGRAPTFLRLGRGLAPLRLPCRPGSRAGPISSPSAASSRPRSASRGAGASSCRRTSATSSTRRAERPSGARSSTSSTSTTCTRSWSRSTCTRTSQAARSRAS
jgi:hydrogenase maturation factor HypF (carbamoyltransferase family)